MHQPCTYMNKEWRNWVAMGCAFVNASDLNLAGVLVLLLLLYTADNIE